jgi:hypothetical protein
MGLFGKVVGFGLEKLMGGEIEKSNSKREEIRDLFDSRVENGETYTVLTGMAMKIIQAGGGFPEVQTAGVPFRFRRYVASAHFHLSSRTWTIRKRNPACRPPRYLPRIRKFGFRSTLRAKDGMRIKCLAFHQKKFYNYMISNENFYCPKYGANPRPTAELFARKIKNPLKTTDFFTLP